MSQSAHDATLAARLLTTIARRVGSSLALDETLDAVANAVVEVLGFRAAVVNLVAPDDELHVVAVAGSDEIKTVLMGTHSSRAAWDAMLTASAAWGELRFLSHRTGLPDGTDDMHFYVPTLPVPEEEGWWHPNDALFAPLLGSTGDLLGVLSVDDPEDRRLPSPEQCALLEAFAVHAALAIEHAHTHKSVQDSALMLSRLFDESPAGKALFGPDGRFVRVNRAYCTFLGRTPKELVGRRVLEFVHPDERDATEALSHEIRQNGSPIAKVEKRYLHVDGRIVWGRLSLTRIDAGDGNEPNVLAVVEDITDARAAEEQLRHHALHDSLTGLPNRTLIFDRLEQALGRARRETTNVAVIVLDIDHFKSVNDSYGHPVGDQLLVATAAALQGALRDSDTAGRLGGDEFIVVCEGVAGAREAAIIAERLRLAIRVPVQVGDVTLLPSASLGCTLTSSDSTADQLVAEADAALYRAKAAGRGRYEMFDEEMRRCSLAQFELRAQLVTALRDDELRLHYQPLVELATGRAIGYEALLRWQHPERGLLHPAEFLPVITDSDLDVPVTQWVLRRACADLTDLAGGESEPFISVNLSPRQLSRPDLINDVESALHDAGVAPGRLWVEITEEHLVDRRHRPTLDKLHALGCRIALDDFGTGYSGLTYLQQLPVDVVKIDRSYVDRVGSDRVSAGITAAVADLADALDIMVVAEGVETREQAAKLDAMGIKFAQGYLFGRPAAVDAQGGDVARLPRPRDGQAEGQPLATVNDSMTTF